MSKLPPDIEGIREMVARFLCNQVADTYTGDYDFSYEQLGRNAQEEFLSWADQLLSKLTEHGARIKINGKWYGLDGTPVKEG